jgi:hypothetical protein
MFLSQSGRSLVPEWRRGAGRAPRVSPGQRAGDGQRPEPVDAGQVLEQSGTSLTGGSMGLVPGRAFSQSVILRRGWALAHTGRVGR